MSVYDSDYAALYDRVWGDEKYALDRALLEPWLRRLPADARILDVGCGTGTHLSWLVERFPNAQGLDASAAMLARAAAKRPGLHLTQGSVCDANLFEAGHFALIYSTYDVLNYLLSEDELVAALAAMYRWLVPGGVIALQLISQEGLSELSHFEDDTLAVDAGDAQFRGRWDLRQLDRPRWLEFVETRGGSSERVHALRVRTDAEYREFLSRAGFVVQRTELLPADWNNERMFFAEK